MIMRNWYDNREKLNARGREIDGMVQRVGCAGTYSRNARGGGIGEDDEGQVAFGRREFGNYLRCGYWTVNGGLNGTNEVEFGCCKGTKRGEGELGTRRGRGWLVRGRERGGEMD